MKSRSGEAEALVKRLMRDRYGLHLRKIKREAKSTPDYEALEDGRRLFVVEVKSLSDVNTREFEPGEIPGSREDLRKVGLADDNGPSRISDHIHEAGKQLRRYDCPKVLAFVSYDDLIDVHDLIAAYKGYLVYEGEAGRSVDKSAMRVAQGRIDGYEETMRLFHTNDVGKGLKERFCGRD